VPLLIWTNFDLPPEAPELSTNALPSYLLEKMGIPPSGFSAVTDAVRRRVPVLARYAGGNARRMGDRDAPPSREPAVIDDYRLFQYDLLLGRRYSLSDSSFGR
jgi:hypothetical protein